MLAFFMPDNIIFTMNKNDLRFKLQQQRKKLSVAQRKIFSHNICQQIEASPVFQSAQHIAF